MTADVYLKYRHCHYLLANAIQAVRHSRMFVYKQCATKGDSSLLLRLMHSCCQLMAGIFMCVAYTATNALGQMHPTHLKEPRCGVAMVIRFTGCTFSKKPDTYSLPAAYLAAQ